MDKYRRVEKSKKDEDTAPVEANEIRITQQGKVRNYISYANGLFSEKNERYVVLKAMGNAISKAVTVAEILKHRIAHLHQLTQISSIETMDIYEPLEEGLDRIETKRHIPGISITLSLDELNKDDPGYQSPIPVELVSVTANDDGESHYKKPARKIESTGSNDNNASKRSGKKKEKAVNPVVENASAAAKSDEQDAAAAREDSGNGGRGSGGSKRGRGRGGRNGGGRRKPRGDSKSGTEGEDDSSAPAIEATTRETKESGSAAPKRSKSGRKPARKTDAVLGDEDGKPAVEAPESKHPTETSNQSPEGEEESGQANGKSSGGRGRGRGRGSRGYRGRGRGRGRGDSGRGNGVEQSESAVVAE